MGNDIIPIILAGGLGKRMNSDLPKVLHTISGVPMIVHVIKSALQLNPERILIVVGKYRSIISKTIETFLGNLHGIHYVDQQEPLGTGHAMQCCIPQLQQSLAAKVLILSGDVPLVSSELLRQISQSNTCCVCTTHMSNPQGYGRIIKDKDSKFVSIVEEKDATPKERLEKQVNGGIYCIKSSLLVEYLPLITNNNANKEYYLPDVIPMIKKQHKVDLYDVEQDNQYQITGVNTQEQLNILELIYQCT